jgi:hypothetical protein
MGNEQSLLNDTHPERETDARGSDTQQLNSNISFNINFSMNQEKTSSDKLPPEVSQTVSQEHNHKNNYCKYGHSCKYKDTTCKKQHISPTIETPVTVPRENQYCKFGYSCKYKDTTCKRQHPSVPPTQYTETKN